jgi:hypothetical protein
MIFALAGISTGPSFLSSLESIVGGEVMVVDISVLRVLVWFAVQD